MVVIARATIEADSTELDGVLDGLDGDPLIAHETDVSTSGPWTIEVRAGEAAVLARFHEACLDRGVVLDVRRITQKSEPMIEPGQARAERENT